MFLAKGLLSQSTEENKKSVSNSTGSLEHASFVKVGNFNLQAAAAAVAVLASKDCNNLQTSSVLQQTNHIVGRKGNIIPSQNHMVSNSSTSREKQTLVYNSLPVVQEASENKIPQQDFTVECDGASTHNTNKPESRLRLSVDSSHQESGLVEVVKSPVKDLQAVDVFRGSEKQTSKNKIPLGKVSKTNKRTMRSTSLEILSWINSFNGSETDDSSDTLRGTSLVEYLGDGVKLCGILSACGIQVAFDETATMGSPEAQANIRAFSKACQELGVDSSQLLSVEDFDLSSCLDKSPRGRQRTIQLKERRVVTCLQVARSKIDAKTARYPEYFRQAVIQYVRNGSLRSAQKFQSASWKMRIVLMTFVSIMSPWICVLGAVLMISSPLWLSLIIVSFLWLRILQLGKEGATQVIVHTKGLFVRQRVGAITSEENSSGLMERVNSLIQSVLSASVSGTEWKRPSKRSSLVT